MNIVKPAIYTESTCALSAGLNRLQWAMRDRKPNAEVAELAGNLQREMVKLQQFIVTEYKGRSASVFKCHGEAWDKPRCDKWCGADECCPR